MAVGYRSTTSFANDGPERQTYGCEPSTTSFAISETRFPLSISIPFETPTMIACLVQQRRHRSQQFSRRVRGRGEENHRSLMQCGTEIAGCGDIRWNRSRDEITGVNPPFVNRTYDFNISRPQGHRVTRTCGNDCERSPPTSCSDNRNAFHCLNRNLGSVPSASRLMFPRCANMISIAPEAAATSNG